MREPSENIYASFKLFMEASKGRPIIEMSAGVNWSKTPACVQSMLHFEIDHHLTYRNYGRSVGGRLVTDVIEYCERVEACSRRRVRCALTNGATDGAHCLMSYLIEGGYIPRDGKVAMVGMAFPVYSSLMTRLGLGYVEIYDERTILPSLATLLAKLARAAPDVVVITLPHNPSGVMMDPDYYRKIMDWAAKSGVVVIVDRVCLMPWDDAGGLAAIFYEGIAHGRCFVIDSPSKSNSLAGIRLGMVLMGEEHLGGFEKELRCRSLNPAVFGSPTFALCRLANLCLHRGLGPARTIGRFMRRHVDAAYLQYPVDFVPPDINFEALVLSFVRAYQTEIGEMRTRVLTNRDSAIKVFGDVCDAPLILDGGFNLLLSTAKMRAINEIADQKTLARAHGVCILTQRCFQPERPEAETYFLRLSLSIPEDKFSEGLRIMRSYYDAA